MITVANPLKNAAKLFVGCIYSSEEAFLKARRILEKRFGAPDFESQTLPFNYTKYYQKEFGENLKRRFLSFKRQVRTEDLAQIKLLTNKIERKISRVGRRLVNIDPGILELSKVVLATTKDYSHRIYLGKGIYAEVTLFYRDKSFHAWNWAYPDYRTPEYIGIFNRIRDLYLHQLKP
ncbi:DUF4416 family protein [Candidatus Omnitrophota bacterium]